MENVNNDGPSHVFEGSFEPDELQDDAGELEDEGLLQHEPLLRPGGDETDFEYFELPEKEASSQPDFPLVRALFDSKNEIGIDLKFRAGDIIEVLAQTHDHSWKGRCNESIGYFHTNFVEPFRAQGKSQGSKKTSTVRFFRGNYVINHAIPPRLFSLSYPKIQGRLTAGTSFGSHAVQDEFSHVRYSCITCQPANFQDSGYLLRQQLFRVPRQTSICICISIYNEDEVMLGVTLNGIMANIKNLENFTAPGLSLGQDAWKTVVICIIADGRSKVNPRTTAMLQLLGVYRDDVMKGSISDKRATAHLFEYTSNATIHEHGEDLQKTIEVVPGLIGSVPCQLIFCLKEKSQKKMNSHQWFFSSFCRSLQPFMCILLEAGTRPSQYIIRDSLRRLAENNEIALVNAPCSIESTTKRDFLNPLAGYATFDQHLSNVLEDPFESFAGHVTNTHKGSLVSYRFRALELNENETVSFYLDGKQDDFHRGNGSVAVLNRRLVAERGLSWALLTGSKSVWRAVTLPNGDSFNEVPLAVDHFILQRRRWINGSNFSSLFELSQFLKIPWMPFRLGRKLLFSVGLLQCLWKFLLHYFAVGNWFLLTLITLRSLDNSILWSSRGHVFAIVYGLIYVLIFMAGLTMCLKVSPRSNRGTYSLLMFSWALLGWLPAFIMIYILVKFNRDAQQQSMGTTVLARQIYVCVVWPLTTIFGIWLLASITMRRIGLLWFSVISYLVVLPGYINVVTTFAVSNAQDVSWGAMGSGRAEVLPSEFYNGLQTDDPPNVAYEAAEKQLLVASDYRLDTKERPTLDEYVRRFGAKYLLCWLFLNIVLSGVILSIPKLSALKPDNGGEGFLYMGIVLWGNAGLLVLQFSGTLFSAGILLKNRFRRGQ